MGLIAAPAQGQKPDIELGRYLATACVSCHRASGGEIPPIQGVRRDDLIGAMAAYRSRTRANVIMQTIAAPLTDDEIAALAIYFESLGQEREK